MHKRWASADIASVHHARYLLRPAALEIFLADRSNALLSFPSPKARAALPFSVDWIHKAFALMRPPASGAGEPPGGLLQCAARLPQPQGM